MATARARRFDPEALARAGALVAVCTLALTASFVGLVSLASGEALGLMNRLPVYVLGMATAFVGAVLLFEMLGRDGRTVIATAGAGSVATFVVLTLGGEGLIHAARNPDQVVASHLLFYFLAAGMIATGVGYWAIRHWSELSLSRPGASSSSGFGR